MKRSLTAVALATLGLAACADEIPTEAAAPAAPPEPAAVTHVAPYLPGRVVVRFTAAALARSQGRTQRMEVAQMQAEDHGARVESEMHVPRAFVLDVQPGTEAQVAASLAADPDVEFAEPDYLLTVIPCETGECESPSGIYMPRKWDLHNAGSIALGAQVTPTGAADADMDWLEAYDALGPAPQGTAVIGILDTGIRSTHQELRGRVIAARNFATGYPASFVDDRDGHGTHVAGIAAAAGVAASGVAYGPGIRLINAKVCERYLFPDGIVRVSCPTSSIANAIVWATDQGAHVLNMSLAGPATATSGPAIQQAALQYARSRNVLPFCATGNDGYHAVAFPARFPECFGVAATNWADGRASYSNYGPGTDIAAPGGASGGGSLGLILSMNSTADNAYIYRAGTSMAAPQVAGLAALLVSQGVGDDEAVLARILETADDLGAPGADAQFGAGRINVCRALDPARLSVQMPGAFNRKSTGVFSVVIHSVPGFDPARLDEARLTLGDGTGAGAHVAVRGDEYRSWLEDADGDGDLDLIAKFDRQALAGAVAAGTTTLTVRGNVGCRRVQGSQSVNVTH